MKNGGKSRNRTDDTRIFSPLLYRLSYLATQATSSSEKKKQKTVNDFLNLFITQSEITLYNSL